MGFAAALGSGFFDQANKQRDIEQQNDLATQRMLMQTWAQTTLPQVMKQRAADDADLANTNTIMSSDVRFQNNPMAAFHAQKMIKAGFVKSPQDYWDQVTSNKIQMPQDAKDTQIQNLVNQGLSPNYDDQGNVSGFTYKPQAQANTAAPIPGAGGKRSLADMFTGKTNPLDNAQTAANKFFQETGVDPNQGVSSKFEAIKTPGVGLSLKSPEQEKLKNYAIDQAFKNIDRVRDPDALMSAIASGDQDAVTKQIHSPDFYLTKQERDAQDVSKALTVSILEHQKDLTPEGQKKVGALMKSTPTVDQLADFLGQYSRRPEDVEASKDELKSKVAFRSRLADALGNPTQFIGFAAAGMYDKGQPGEGLVAADKLEDAKKRAVDVFNKEHTNIMTKFEPLSGGTPDNTAPGTGGGAANPPPPAGYAPPGAKPAQAAAAPQQQPQQTSGGSPSTTNPQPQGDVSYDKPVNPMTAPGNRLDTSKLPSVNLPKETTRLGDAPGSTQPYNYSPAVQAQVDKYSPEGMANVNPITALNAASYYKAKGTPKGTKLTPENILANIRFTDADMKMLASPKNTAIAQKTDAQLRQLTAQYPAGIQKKDIKDAAESVPVGGLYVLPGDKTYRFMDAATKAKWTVPNE